MKLSEEEDIEIKMEDMSTLDDLQAYSNFQTKEKDPPIEKVRFCLTSLRTIFFFFYFFQNLEICTRQLIIKGTVVKNVLVTLQ